jgi:hypothetical protein
VSAPPPLSPSANLVVAFLRDRDEPCPKCRYNLRNAAAAVCPECGAAATLVLERPGGFLSRLASRLAAFVLVARLAASLLAVIFSLWLMITNSRSPNWWEVDRTVWAAVTVAWSTVWIILAIRRRGTSMGGAGRSLVIGALGLGALETAHLWLGGLLGFVM